jgi:beta-xylosidase
MAGPPTRDLSPGVMVLEGPLDWGDPALVESQGTYYLYASGSLPGVNVKVETATPGGPWSGMHDVLPALPAWAAPGETWAPDVHRFGRAWVLYFAATRAGTHPLMHCIGAAVATTPSGPFMPTGAPLACPLTLGGAIDPRVYVSPRGAAYLTYKSDNNVSPAFGPTVIWSEPLSADGLAAAGPPTAIFRPDQPWQHGLVEAPDMVTVAGHTWLFFSGGVGYWDPNYAVGVAECAGPSGPCRDHGSAPLLASNAQGVGPGEESVFAADGRYWLVYNAARVDDGSGRSVALTPLTFGPAGPSIGGSAAARGAAHQPGQR